MEIETLEEVANEYAKNKYSQKQGHPDEDYYISFLSFKAGAKWQQEKQDEFAIGFLNSIRDYELENGSRICFDERDSKELLEIYKKK